MTRKKRRLPTLLLAAVLAAAAAGPLSATDPLKSLSQQFKDRLRNRPGLSIAVLNFTYPKGRLSTGSYLVSERLVTYLVQKGAVVMERRLLEKILEEQAFWETGAVDPHSLKKIGALSGVDAVVVGKLKDASAKSTEVTARLIRVDSGEVLATAVATIERLWRDNPRVPRLLRTQTPIPFASSVLGVSSLERQMSRADEAPAPAGRRRTLSDMEPAPKKSRYQVAPVPFAMPSVHNLNGGSLR